jgi:hypothetical protein
MLGPQCTMSECLIRQKETLERTRRGRRVRVAGLTALAGLQRVTSAGEARRGHIGETLLPRAGDRRPVQKQAIIAMELPASRP